MLEVKRIEPEMAYNIRHIVLRPHQAIEDCKYDTDHEANGFHLGVFSQGKLIDIE